MKPLYCGHHRVKYKCPECRGVLISGCSIEGFHSIYIIYNNICNYYIHNYYNYTFMYKTTLEIQMYVGCHTLTTHTQ